MWKLLYGSASEIKSCVLNRPWLSLESGGNKDAPRAAPIKSPLTFFAMARRVWPRQTCSPRRRVVVNHVARLAIISQCLARVCLFSEAPIPNLSRIESLFRGSVGSLGALRAAAASPITSFAPFRNAPPRPGGLPSSCCLFEIDTRFYLESLLRQFRERNGATLLGNLIGRLSLVSNRSGRGKGKKKLSARIWENRSAAIPRRFLVSRLRTANIASRDNRKHTSRNNGKR